MKNTVEALLSLFHVLAKKVCMLACMVSIMEAQQNMHSILVTVTACLDQLSQAKRSVVSILISEPTDEEDPHKDPNQMHQKIYLRNVIPLISSWSKHHQTGMSCTCTVVAAPQINVS
eukprot:6251175-Ditylum_brightwellii.AAC.1